MLTSLCIVLCDDGLQARPKHVALLNICNNDIDMLGGEIYETFLEIQHQNGMIFTKTATLYEKPV
jgi:hypothetical protein